MGSEDLFMDKLRSQMLNYIFWYLCDVFCSEKYPVIRDQADVHVLYVFYQLMFV